MYGTPIGQECRPIQGLNPLPIDVLMRSDSNLSTANRLDTGLSAIGRNDRLPLIKTTVLVEGEPPGSRLGEVTDFLLTAVFTDAIVIGGATFLVQRFANIQAIFGV